MAHAARQPHSDEAAHQRTSTVCRIHSCMRCKAAIDSQEPCSFLRTESRICGVCRGQEQALRHFPASRGFYSRFGIEPTLRRSRLTA